MFYSHAQRNPRRGRSVPSYWLAGLVTSGLLLSVFTTSTPATAQTQQLTKEFLIGPSVSEIGPRFNDIDSAIQRFRNNDVAAARRFLELSREKNPQLPPVQTMLARMFLTTRNAANARASLEQAITEVPSDPEAYLILADQASAENRVAEVEGLLLLAAPLVEAYEGNAKRKRNFVLRLYAGRALAAERRRRYEEAIADLKKWIAEDPESATAHQRLGHALFMSADSPSQYAEAIKKFELARKYQPTLPHPSVAAARRYHLKEDEANAKEAFREAVSKDGKNPGTLLSYAQWLLETGDAAAARTPLAAARRLSPNSLQALVLSGVAARINGDADEAEKHLLAAHSLAPSNREVINQLATLLVMSDDAAKRQRALQFARINAQLYSRQSETAVTLAWVRYQLGQLAEAQAALQNARMLGRMNADSTYFVAKIQYDQERPDNAKLLLEDALKRRGLFVHRDDANALLEVINKGQDGS